MTICDSITRNAPLSSPAGIRPTAALLGAILIALTAGHPAAQGLAPIDLGSAARFAVLAGSLVSDIPTSAVTGDIGLSPAAGSMITGFGPAEVTGTIYTSDATGPAGSVPDAGMLTTAKGDLTIAYNDAVGRTPVPTGPFLNPGSGDIGGLTLVPGLYKFTSGLSITGLDVTLTGGPTDVWIFQIASNLVVGNGIKVTLAGGALPANIFWQVGTSATLGTTSAFQGTILADQSISMNTGASLDGRALASIAAVTLASNAITRPPPAPAALYGRGQAPRAFLRNHPDRPGRTARIEFSVPRSGWSTLVLLDSQGREVAALFDGRTEAGRTHHVRIGTERFAQGLHFSKLSHDGNVHVAKMLLVD